MRLIHARLQPLLYQSRPTVWSLIASGGWRHVFFLQRSLASVLRATGLPDPIIQAIAIWTHVAGQTLQHAPSPLAFVPALMHEPGAFYPQHGIGSVVKALATAAQAAGVVIRLNTRVSTIRNVAGAVSGVELADGAFIPATTVLSNAHGVGSYCDLVQDLPTPARQQLERLPLQSPGICAYLSVKLQASAAPQPYLRFRLPPGDELCRLLVTPGVLAPEANGEGWSTARLIAPMRHNQAQLLGEAGQRAFAEQLLAEPWWRAHVAEAKVLHVRTPHEWGQHYHLHRDSMNPVMTAAFMRQGRLAHRSPFIRGLHLAGSSTHPGQWLSFSAISGILSADQIKSSC
jgi:phytoene dehydrogenase-like protein